MTKRYKLNQNPSKLVLKKTFAQRSCLAAYIFCILSFVPSFTMSLRFGGGGNPVTSFFGLLSLVFAIFVIRRQVTENCVLGYAKHKEIVPNLFLHFLYFLKPTLNHLPLLMLPAAISFVASGGSHGMAGAGLGAAICIVGVAYCLSIDIPFRSYKKIISEIKKTEEEILKTA